MFRLLEEELAAERLEYYKRAVHTEHLHDVHYPVPLDSCGLPVAMKCGPGTRTDSLGHAGEGAVEEKGHGGGGLAKQPGSWSIGTVPHAGGRVSVPLGAVAQGRMLARSRLPLLSRGSWELASWHEVERP